MVWVKKIFKKKLIIIYLIILFIVVIVNIFYLYLSSSLKITGKNNIEINYGEKYKDEGATFKIFKSNLSKKIKVKTNINYEKIGKYKITYSAKYLIFNIKKERIVNIIDSKPPTIILKGENQINVCPDSIYKEVGYKAIDEYDGDITDKVKKNIDGHGNIIYEVSDSSGNKTSIKRKIETKDNESPKIKLKGNSTIYIRLNTNYQDYGYEVTDNCDDLPKVEVINNLDTARLGTYTITYKAIDSSNNTSSITRNIIVYDDKKEGIVYLTFDDGPSGTGSTEKILNVLKNHGVKATFFVTSNGPDSLITRAYNEGHKIALHTSTHKYSYVYASVDNYFEDLKTVQNRVYRLTGEYSKIIRFPGGSNNTVSNRYSNGIMDILTKEVIKEGYSYFDWNVSSGDAGECSTPECVYNNVINGLSKNRINVILMHDIKMFTADALDNIIEYCKLNGYTFKAIDETTYPVRFK